MAKAPTVARQPVEEVEKVGRKPDYTVLLRQQPSVGSDGKLYRSDAMSVVGAAWLTEKPDRETGEVVQYIGVKFHVPVQVGPDGILLRTYKERE